MTSPLAIGINTHEISKYIPLHLIVDLAKLGGLFIGLIVVPALLLFGSVIVIRLRRDPSK